MMDHRCLDLDMAICMTHAQPFACLLNHVLDLEQYALAGVWIWGGRTWRLI